MLVSAPKFVDQIVLYMYISYIHFLVILKSLLTQVYERLKLTLELVKKEMMISKIQVKVTYIFLLPLIFLMHLLHFYLLLCCELWCVIS